MNKKYGGRLLLILFIMAIGFLGYNDTGQATPHKEHFKMGSRDYIMGDEGDSSVGSREVFAKDNIKKPGVTGQPEQAPANGLMSALDSVFAPSSKTLTMAYTCVAEQVVVEKIVPAFQRYWYEKTGQEVNFITGYALPDFDSLATSVSGKPVQLLIMASSTNVESRGYSPTKWQGKANNGVVFSIPQVFLVRKGNPLGIKTFADLAIPGVRVIHVNPILGNGTGMYPVWGIYGSALKESEVTTGKKSYQAANDRLQKVEENAFYETTDMPSTIKAFLKGMGDVFVMPENAALNVVKKNDSVEIVVPPYTISNDFSIYKMDRNLGFGDEAVASAFIDFLFSQEVQEDAASVGYRPSDPGVLAANPKFNELVNPFPLNYLGEQTEAKKRILLGKWLTINNTRFSNEQGN